MKAGRAAPQLYQPRKRDLKGPLSQFQAGCASFLLSFLWHPAQMWSKVTSLLAPFLCDPDELHPFLLLNFMQMFWAFMYEVGTPLMSAGGGCLFEFPPLPESPLPPPPLALPVQLEHLKFCLNVTG